jgi:predicted RNA binding protein YcfA (HicA-like mRNA interferase family)
MLASPGKIRFVEIKALVLHEGFILLNTRGSHRTFHREDGRVLNVVEPHGNRKTCHPDDVRRVLEALER